MLIPFIDETRLISAMKDCESRLTDEERKRNQHGPMQVYVFTEKDLGKPLLFFLSNAYCFNKCYLV